MNTLLIGHIFTLDTTQGFRPEAALATMLTLAAMVYVLTGQGGGCLQCRGKLRHKDDCPLRKD